MRPPPFWSAPRRRKLCSKMLCYFGPYLCPFRTGKDGIVKSINYFGQQITVTDEVAEFLEQDRLRNAALLKQEKRHVDYVGFDIASVPDLFTDDPSDPTFERAFRNIRKQALRNAWVTLSDDDRKLLCLYYYHELSMEEIGKKYGVTKMAISKRLRKLHDRLRSLIEK